MCLFVPKVTRHHPSLSSRVQVFVFSSSHVSGEQLAQLSGVAALLRFPMPDMDCFDAEQDSEED